jgi:hypothetical protein
MMLDGLIGLWLMFSNLIFIIRKWLCMLTPEERCELSRSMGPYDYHDYLDSIYGEPWHMVLLTCKRCGKQFYI